MRDQFKTWLSQQNISQLTQEMQLQRAERIERAYGDLDDLFDADRLAGVMATFAFSKADEKASRGNPSKLPIDGDLYNNLSTYRSTLNRYIRFRDALAGDNTTGEWGPAVAFTVISQFFGPPRTPPTKKMAAWETRSGRELALVLDAAKSVTVWSEQPPEAEPRWQVSHYPSTRSRHSNLASAAPQLAAPNEAWATQIASADDLSDFLAWYDEVQGAQLNLDPEALEAARAEFLRLYPGFQDFQGEGVRPSQEGPNYDRDERAYKDELRAIFEDRVMPLARAKFEGGDLGAESLTGAFYEVMTKALPITREQPNLLNWRALAPLKPDGGLHAPIFDEELAHLLFAPEDQFDRLDRFVSRIGEGLHSVGINSGYLDMARSMGTAALMLADPQHAMIVRFELIENALKRLCHRRLAVYPEGAGRYRIALALANGLFTHMQDVWAWRPRDLMDVQGFLWVTRTLDAPTQTTAAHAEEAIMVDGQRSLARDPQNLILYGPPGTGKTYKTAYKAVEICDGEAPIDREAVMARYRSLVEAKRISFVTFHQSYAYEDFVEGLRPSEEGAVGDDEAARGGFSLRVHQGVFTEIAERARSNRGKVRPTEHLDRDRGVFKMSLGRSGHPEDDKIYRDAIEGGYIVLGYGGEIDWSGPQYDKWSSILERWRQVDSKATGNDPNVTQTYSFRTDMKVGDLVVVSEGNKAFRAIGEVTGDYYYEGGYLNTYNHRRSVNWLWTTETNLPVERIYGKGFSQVSVYRMNDRNIQWDELERIVIGADETKLVGEPEPYVLIIDEINRANVSKVFGELITLIEPDKRENRQNALIATLPYSKRPFSVPANLHIIGTMNTADRSISLLDTALRRRFDFEELMPDPGLLKEASAATGEDLESILATLNARIEYLFDREHQIGHAFFIGRRSRSEVDMVMRKKVIPLLTEYFYEDWNKVRLVLGESKDAGSFITRSKLSAPKGLEDPSDEPRWRYSVNETFPADAYEQLKS